MSKKALARIVVPFVLKAAADQASRTFEGLAATWDKDQGNDVIHKGAFKDTLANWKASGDAMPLLNSHNHFDIFSAIGQMTAAKETKEGLLSSWEVIPGAEGDAVMNRLRPSKTTGRPLVGKMSIGFIPTKFSFEQPEGTDSFFDRVRHIEKADLKEVSLVLFPMNENAAVDASSVKMFLKQLALTDPREVTNLDRMMFRKLASRIGSLLKIQPVDKKVEDPKDEDLDDDEIEDEIDEQDDPPAPKSVPDLESDTDDDDSEIPPVKKSGILSEPKIGEPVVYQMGDALTQRLQRTLLKARTSDIREAQ